ncbi:MAG: DNA polymerase III subunit alpha [Acidobacteriota bacterium]
MPIEANYKPFSSKDFVHLHLHSDYSLLQSTIQLKPLAKRLGELDLKACALTDYGNMYGAVSFFNIMSASGVKPIIGYEAYLTVGSRFERSSALRPGEKPYYRIILLAQNIEGYRNLTYLASKAFTEGFLHRPRIDLEILAERSEGLVGLSSGQDEAVGHYLNDKNEQRAIESAKGLEDIFGKGNFFLEIQDHVDPQSLDSTKRIVEFSKSVDIPLVATNDVHYMNRGDERAQAALIALADGRTLSENSRSDEDSLRYLRSADEMWEIFGGELPESLTNTVRIAEMCDFVMPQGDEHRQLPTFPIPPEFSGMSTDDYFVKVLDDGFEDRKRTQWEPQLGVGQLKHSLAEYRERLEVEIATIKKMGFPGYFLIVWDFIKYAYDQGIPVGPGRGSAAGSLAAYVMRITDVDPLQHELLFERFLNPERISMPDIDIDFCIRGRGDVIDHVTQLYGRDSVCQIVTFGTMASRAAIKDVGRVLNMPYGDVEKIAKMIPPPIRGRNVSISQAIEMVPELKAAMASDARVKDLVELALKIEGCARHTSVHAAGVVISPRPLHELVPVKINDKDELTSQYPMNDLEKVGMLKMDFLGLTTLTVIADCLATIKDKLGVTIDWATIPNNEEKTMQLFGEGRTEAIFQFESSGMAEMCRRLKPKELEDLSALNALYRPGPLDGGMIDDFIDRHRGIKPTEYIVPEMEDILGNTFGVLVYQEQIMQLAQKLAGYSLGEADLMRRAMGKKKIDEMQVHETKFVEGAVSNGIARKTAKEIFELMAKFADYGFNRSHSMAYAVLAFQTAYLKAHYPAHFYASVLSHEAQDSAKVYKYSTELRSMGLSLLPPDINESDEGFTPGDGAVRYGLTAIKGMGTASVQAIVEARKAGKFTSLYDFCSKLGAGAVNRRGLESLVTAGAFDSQIPYGSTSGEWRPRLYAAIDSALSHGQRMASDKSRGQGGLFGAVETDDVMSDESLPAVAPWTKTEISKHEKAAIGFYLSAHPLDNYTQLLQSLQISNFADYGELKAGDTVTMGGIISALAVRQSKKGNRFCMFRLEDRSGGIKAIAWGEAFQKFTTLLKDDEMVVVEGRIEATEGQEPTLIVNEIRSLDESVATTARSMTVSIPETSLEQSFLEEVFVTLGAHHGKCEVFVSLPVDDAIVKIHAPGTRVEGTRALQRKLEAIGCVVDWAH